MGNYIAFIAGLPDISYDDRSPAATLAAFREDAADYLGEKDSRLLDLLLMTEDNRQVLRLLSKQGADASCRTVFPLQTLAEAVEDDDDSVLPDYLCEFIRDFKGGRLKYAGSPENVLSRMYFEALESCGNPFIAKYAEFKRNMKNLVAALNSRKFGKSVADEVVGAGEFVDELKNSQLKDFGLSGDYGWVERVVALMSQPDLVAREKGLDEVEWNYLEEALTFKYFSIEVVIAYLLKLKTLDRWSRMDGDSGRKVFMELVDKFRSDLKFGEQFV